ncbi:MAG: dihydroneopterin aldolase [Chlamydiales bacterium]
MEGIVKIRDYRVRCIVGVYPEERSKEQELSVDIELKWNIQEVVQTDSIVDTIDYEKVAKVCRDLAKSSEFHLLETFAYETLSAIFDEFEVSWVKVTVKKTQPFPLAREVAFELERKR